MSESPDAADNPAQQALAALGLIVDELSGLIAKSDGSADATVDDDLLHRSERTIAMGIAMLVTTREDAATALEASVAGAARRDEPAQARDLLLVAGVLQQALRRAMEEAAHATSGAAPDEGA